MPTLSGRILIVEDEVVISLLLETFVGKLGLEVVGVADHFEEAVALFEQEQPDAVLMDVSIVGSRDGVETARAIKALRDVPIVFLTAYTDPATQARLAEVSPHGVLSKPFDEERLSTLLASALAAAHSA